MTPEKKCKSGLRGVILSDTQYYMAQNTKRKGALPRRKSVPVSIPIPRTWEDSINRAVSDLDTDRSKLVRAALREKLERMGITVPKLAA
jgi:hypothetical protein